MNEEVEQLKERIYSFLDNKNLTEESQYFLLLSMTEELKDTILDTDDEDVEDEPEEEDQFEDFEDDVAVEEEDDIENDEDVIDIEPEEVKEIKKPVTPPPSPPKPQEQKPTSNHNIRMKELLKKKNVSDN